jgi:hypothetical protein
MKRSGFCRLRLELLALEGRGPARLARELVRVLVLVRRLATEGGDLPLALGRHSGEAARRFFPSFRRTQRGEWTSVRDRVAHELLLAYF